MYATVVAVWRAERPLKNERGWARDATGTVELLMEVLLVNITYALPTALYMHCTPWVEPAIDEDL